METPEKYDVVILGSGPAGLQAAIHAARKKVSVLVLGKEVKSSLYHAHIENFCCVFNVTGEQILTVGRRQAANFGAHFIEEDVLRVTASASGYGLEIESDAHFVCQALVIATGAQRNRLGAPGEKKFLGKGVSYCVDCDGNFYKGASVAVIGGESAAVDGALTLARIASNVYLISESLDISPVLDKKLSASSVKVLTGTKVKAIEGEKQVERVSLQNGAQLPVSGVFIELGAKGLMELAANLGVCLDSGMRFIQTDKQQATNIEGIFAAGDICGPPWQMAKAVGEGCVAGLNAADHAKKRSWNAPPAKSADTGASPHP